MSDRFFLGDVTTIQVPDEYFDALLLDMMTPWTVIESLLPKLKPAANIVCVQPNIVRILFHLAHNRNLTTHI